MITELDPKLIEQLLNALYKYAIIGGIILIAGTLLRNFVAVLVTNIWSKLISRSKITLDDTQIYIDGHWWKIRQCGWNRVKLFRPNKREDGTIDEEAPEILMEMPLSEYWKSRITYR